MIKEDKSYLSNSDLLAIESGFAKLDIYSLRIDREDFTEEQKEQNKKLCDSVTREEWCKICDENKRNTALRIEPLIEALSNKFNIHQYKNNSMEHFRSNWDLYFWCNGNNDGSRDYSYITLTFNEKRTVEERYSDLEKILNYIKEIGFDGIDVHVQYTTTYEEEKIKNYVNEYIKNIINTAINYNGYIGKIKNVGKDNKGNECYGFSKE